ncbi:hypothetical protein HDZ31DRAFT_60266 [Schizophyllum fasciatum]
MFIKSSLLAYALLASGAAAYNGTATPQAPYNTTSECGHSVQTNSHAVFVSPERFRSSAAHCDRPVVITSGFGTIRPTLGGIYKNTDQYSSGPNDVQVTADLYDILAGGTHYPYVAVSWYFA